MPIQKAWRISILLPKLIFWVLVDTLSQFSCSVPFVIQKQWKKPHHYCVINSSGLYTKDKRGTRGAYCSLATSFGPPSAMLALLTGWSSIKKQRTSTTLELDFCLFSLLLGYLQWLWELLIKFSSGYASRYCAAEQLTVSFSARWIFYHFTELDWLPIIQMRTEVNSM